MRIAFAISALALLTGCANSPPLDSGRVKCYLLVEDKTPVAEVCEQGSKLKYTEILPGDAAYTIPPYVQAIMQVHGKIEAPDEIPSTPRR